MNNEQYTRNTHIGILAQAQLQPGTIFIICMRLQHGYCSKINVLNYGQCQQLSNEITEEHMLLMCMMLYAAVATTA